MATVTINISRDHRDAIFEEVESVLRLGTDLPLYLEQASADHDARDWLQEFPRRLAVAVGLLRQLGWQERGDRESYLLEIDEEIAGFMAGMEHNALGGLEDNRSGLSRRRDWALRYGKTYTDGEWAEEQATTRWLIDRDLDALNVARRAQAAYREVG